MLLKLSLMHFGVAQFIARISYFALNTTQTKVCYSTIQAPILLLHFPSRFRINDSINNPHKNDVQNIV